VHKYTLIVRKNDVAIELTSEYKELIEQEADKFRAALAKYEKKKVLGKLKKKIKQVKTEDESNIAYGFDLRPKEKAPLLDEIQNEAPAPVENETPLETIQTETETIEKPSEDFIESALDFITKEETPELYETQSESVKEEFVEQEDKMEQAIKADNPFSKVLKSKLKDKIKTKMVEKKDAEAEINLDKIKMVIESRNPQTVTDYIVLAAYHLTYNEKQERFTLKDINNLIYSFAKQEIDVIIMQEALEQNFLRVLPDYTGLITVPEYELTDNGERYFLNEL